MSIKNHWSGRIFGRKQAVLFLISISLNFNLAPAALGGTSPPKDGSVIFGAVGHNDRPGDNAYPYNKISIAKQVDLLGDMGLKAFRSGCNDSTCSTLASLTAARGVLFLRSIELRPDVSMDEDGNYQRGYNYARKEGLKYKGSIHFYEASNELDNWTGMVGDGGNRIQYNALRYPKARGFLKGLIDGIHSADSTAKVAVDDAGYCHYGFLNALWEDGVRWDITAFHWYSNQGNIEKANCRDANVASIHAKFGRPIWITEFSLHNGPGKDDRAARGKWISGFVSQIRSIAPKYNIQAAFAYELLDEPNAKGGESFYGILDKDGAQKVNWKGIFKP